MKKIYLLFVICCLFFPLPAAWNWEVNFHASYWTLNLLKSLVEEKLGEVMEENLKDKILEDLRQDYPFIYERNYYQKIEFDTRGSNFGLELRWYPGGRNGFFSIGLALEKSRMKIGFPLVAAGLDLGFENSERNAVFDALVEDAYVEIKPFSYHLNFRFEIIPSGTIHPYVTIGAGIFQLQYLEKGKVNISYSGKLKIEGGEEKNYGDSINKTIVELLEESEDEVKLPKILPIIQLNAGIKAKISEIIDLFADFGIFNGFLFRGGLAFRF